MFKLIMSLIRNGKGKFLMAAIVGAVVVFQWDSIINNWDAIQEALVGSGGNTTNTTSPRENPRTSGGERSTTGTKSSGDVGSKGEIGQRPKSSASRVTSQHASRKLKLVSWNMCNIGISKDDKEIEYMADMLKDYDIIAVQEISTKLSGPRAIVKLNEQLNLRGDKWDYVISDPTSGTGSERYAYLWKKGRTKLSGRTWLAKARSLDDKLDREPFMARFYVGNDAVLIANFHAVPTSKKPEKEIAELDDLHRAYKKDNLIILGDFNLSQKHAAFDELKDMGFKPALTNRKTSIRRVRSNGEHLAQEYDNIFFEKEFIKVSRSGVIDFAKNFESLKEARAISDHIPVWVQLEMN